MFSLPSNGMADNVEQVEAETMKGEMWSDKKATLLAVVKATLLAVVKATQLAVVKATLLAVVKAN